MLTTAVLSPCTVIFCVSSATTREASAVTVEPAATLHRLFQWEQIREGRPGPCTCRPYPGKFIHARCVGLRFARISVRRHKLHRSRRNDSSGLIGNGSLHRAGLLRITKLRKGKSQYSQ